MSNSRPKLVVFDLDYTLWPFWVDSHVDPPFNKDGSGVIRDAHGREVKSFPEVPQVLARLHADGFKVAVASRTGCIQEANTLTKLFDWDKYFVQKEIYPGRKVKHFERFHEGTGIPLKDMLFFDDEQRNVKEVGALGVTCIFVDKGVGVSQAVVEEGMKEFARRLR